MRRRGKARHINDDQRRLNGLLYDYLVTTKMSLPDGKNVHECVYWWRNDAIRRKDILEAFKNYIEGKLTKEFESCRGSNIMRL